MKRRNVSGSQIQLPTFFNPIPINTIPNNHFQTIFRLSYPTKLRIFPVTRGCKCTDKLSIKGVKNQIA